MKIPFEWLKEFVDINISAKDLAKKLTMAGVEVAGFEASGKEYVFDIDILPNRGDCQSIIGVAREVAAILGTKIKKSETCLPTGTVRNPKSEVRKLKTGKCISVQVKDKRHCPRYMAKVIKDVEIKESPNWLKNRLLLAGLRPINNIVDVTNYLLLERGQPMHAFDMDLIANQTIVVRKAQKKEKLVTLDGTERVLDEEFLVIADSDKPIALAGIMGGQNTEVSPRTKNIVLESAFFDFALINKTSRKIKLRTESSMRFGKGVDYQQVEEALAKAAEMIQKLSGGKIMPDSIDIQAEKITPPQIKLRLSRIPEVLGREIPERKILSILEGLGLKRLKVEKKKSWLLAVPFSRAFDLTREIDLIEEIARVFGYDKFDAKLPDSVFDNSIKSSNDEIHFKIKECLSSSGLFEAQTYTMISPKDLDLCNLPDNYKKTVKISNPLTEEQSILRPLILPGLLHVLSYNANRQNKGLAFYEIGKVFSLEEKNEIKEKLSLEGAIISRRHLEAIHEEEFDFFNLKGLVENILAYLKIKNYLIEPVELNFYQSGHCGQVKYQEKAIATFGKIHPHIAKNYDLKEAIFYFYFDLEVLLGFGIKIPKYAALSKYPILLRDLALLVPEKVANEEIQKIIFASGAPLIKKVELFDYYAEKKKETGFASMAYHLDFSYERTLTDEEVNAKLKDILEALAKIGVKLRE